MRARRCWKRVENSNVEKLWILPTGQMQKCPCALKRNYLRKHNYGSPWLRWAKEVKTTIYVQWCVTIYISWLTLGSSKKYTWAIKIIIYYQLNIYIYIYGSSGSRKIKSYVCANFNTRWFFTTCKLIQFCNKKFFTVIFFVICIKVGFRWATWAIGVMLAGQRPKKYGSGAWATRAKPEPKPLYVQVDWKLRVSQA